MAEIGENRAELRCSSPDLVFSIESSIRRSSRSSPLAGHEDDSVVELANEVRKVMASLQLLGAAHIAMRAHHLPLVQHLPPLPEAAAVMDSR